MRNGYFKVIELMQNPGASDEKSEFVEISQKELLTKVLKNALRNVPYYRDNVPINPDDVETTNVLEVLKRFPLLNKEEVMRHPEDFVSDKFNKSILYHVTSGGSTGTGIGVWRTLEELQIEQAFFDHMWSYYGYNQKSKVVKIEENSITPVELPPYKKYWRKLLISPLHMNEKWLPSIVDKIIEFGAEIIHGYASCLEQMALYLKKHRISIKIKAIFLASEEVKPDQIELFNEVYGVPICFHYGATEQVLLGHGCYVDNKIVYHFNPLYGIVENYLDENGNYELVGTGLWNHAMPLIRYRTQDFGKIENVIHECPKCGNRSKTILQLDGRMQNYLVTRYGTFYPECLIPMGKFLWKYVKTCQFVQNTPGELELRFVPNEQYSNEVEAEIISWEKKELSEWFDLTFLKVDDIPLTRSGKRRLVVVNHEFDTNKNEGSVANLL
jgi:phenylacetate-CoA ligase